jgi:hypothetical protein
MTAYRELDPYETRLDFPSVTLDAAWAEATAALPAGARIVTTEHVEHDFAFAAIVSDEKVYNVLSWDGEPDYHVVSWGADSTLVGALLELASKLRALP